MDLGIVDALSKGGSIEINYFYLLKDKGSRGSLESI